MIAILFAAALVDPTAQVEALDWMAGSWAQTRGETTVRETWLPPLDGAMAGASQTNRPGRTPSIEHMTITITPQGAAFTAYPPGQAPTVFLLRPNAVGEAVFENPEHDFPQRVIYRRCGADLCARIEGAIEGETRQVEWRYIRLP